MANYVLEILDGDRAGDVLPVGDATLRIGRKPGNDVVIADEKTSGVHCEITPEGDRLVLRDLGSTNGTFLDGKRITEMVLTPGDVVTIGRTRVRFGTAGDERAAAADGEFAVRTLDAARLKRRGGSLGLVALLVVVAAAGGGWFWWQGRQESGGSAGPARRSEPLVVAGNRLEAAVAGCEQEDGWELRAGGLGFRSGGDPHTGTGAFFAARGGDESDQPAADADFAILRLAAPLPVFAGRAMTVAAHCRTSGGALVTVRARLFAESEQSPFRFVVGAPLAARDDGYTRVETQIAVPTGCDRLDVEVVAVLPTADAEATVDDVSVVEGGAATALELRPPDSGQTAFGCGPSIAVRSTDADNPATVQAVLPDDVPAALQGLHTAGACVLSDLGATLEWTAGERGFSVAATGVDGLRFVLPADAAGGLLVAGADGRFTSAAAESAFEAQAVLLGSHATRAELRFDAPTALRGQLGGGLYRLSFASPRVELVLGFRAERQQAQELLRRAEAAAREGRPGAALDELAELSATVPMDTETLAAAQALRGELLTAQAAELQRLARDLEEARVFSTRGGFERVAAGVDDLLAQYGEHNVEDLDAAKALREAAQAQLAALDRQQQAVQRERLTELADAFGAARQDRLQALVQQYIDRHLPAAPEPGGPGGGRGGGDGGR